MIHPGLQHSFAACAGRQLECQPNTRGLHNSFAYSSSGCWPQQCDNPATTCATLALRRATDLIAQPGTARLQSLRDAACIQ